MARFGSQSYGAGISGTIGLGCADGTLATGLAGWGGGLARGFGYGLWADPAGLSAALAGGIDTLVGSSGRDIFTATAAAFGADSLDGGAGIDALQLTDAGVFNMNRLAAFANIEVIQGAAAGGQTVQLRDGANLTVHMGAGQNTVTTGATGVQSIALGTGANTVNAGAGTTVVLTGGGTDTINGGTGALHVRAAAGVATVVAGIGGSYVDGGWGSVNLSAGAGKDVIHAGRGTGTVNVTGFTQGIDQIQLHGAVTPTYADVLANATVSTAGGNTVIAFNFGPTVTLIGITAISAADFSLV